MTGRARSPLSLRERALAWGRAGEWGAALDCARRALRLAPDSPELHHQVGCAAAKLGLADRAVDHFRLAGLGSDNVAPLVCLATFCPGAPGVDMTAQLAIRRRLARALASRHRSLSGSPEPRPRARAGRLRVGYLSAHFTWAPYMRPVWGVVNAHDRERVDVHLFADGGEPPFEGYRPHRRDRVSVTRSLDPEALHEHLRAAELDVLVDLSGYGAPTRAAAFLSSPAPVCISWFNAFGSNALPGIRYQLADRVVCPPGDEVHFSERILRLPRTYLAFEQTTPAPDVAASPSSRGEPFTFGCLAPLYKLTAPTLDAWCAILRALPDTRMLLGHAEADGSSNREHLLRRFEQRGVERARIRLLGSAPNEAFMGYYAHIDLALDTSPYSGGTTTMEALWQGVPVLTDKGERWAARTSASLLVSAGLGELVAADASDLVGRARALAASSGSDRLRRWRRTLRDQVAGSRACAVADQARSFERCYSRLFEVASRAFPDAGGVSSPGSVRTARA